MSITDMQPWWSVSIACKRDDEDEDNEREFCVQAPSSEQAVMVAIGAVDFSQDGPIHMIHVSRSLKRPRDDMGAFGWHELNLQPKGAK